MNDAFNVSCGECGGGDFRCPSCDPTMKVWPRSLHPDDFAVIDSASFEEMIAAERVLLDIDDARHRPVDHLSVAAVIRLMRELPS